MNKRIVLLGAGNVATHIALALKKRGCAPIQVWSRTMASSSVLAEKIGCMVAESIDDVVYDADIYIISVADNALSSVIDRLCENHKGGVFVHTAGTMYMQLFAGRAEHYGVLYPMQTFSKSKPLDFSKVPCFIEANDKFAFDMVSSLASQISCKVVELSGENRVWLHIAAVFACNFSNACYAMAARLLKEHGLDFDIMLPLIEETTSKLHALSPVEAQTGPAVRGDTNVMNMHLSKLSGDCDLQTVYKIMSDEIQALCNGKRKC